MEHNKIMLSFKGDITSELLTSVLQIMESKLDNLQESPKVKKKIYNVLVEVLQNLYHHMAEHVPTDSKKARSAIFLISKQDDQYSIITGNYITQEGMNALKSKMDMINEMSRDELKTYYKEVLNNGLMSDKGGGGLGMIDIAKKTGEKLNYAFLPVDDQYHFFSLNVKISQNIPQKS